MAVTRDAHTDPAIGHLFQALNACAEGHHPYVVLEAAANFFVCSLAHGAISGTMTRGATLNAARKVSKNLVNMVAEQIDRRPNPSDIKVPPHG